MRVLHLDTGKEMRGGQRQALLLMRGLRERGHECELLARPASPLWNAAIDLRFRVSEATLGPLLSHSTKVDLVHAHDAHGHTLAAIASRKPFVVSRRVAFPVKRGLASRWKYGRATRYLAVSRFVARELTTAGVPERKIDVVYDGFESTVAPAPSDIFKVVALDSSDPLKGRELIAKSGKRAGVCIHFSTDLARDLPSASVFAYGTESEGLGSAVLFAMSLEIAVVASRVGGLPEIVEDGETGLLVENKPECFAQAINSLADDGDLRRRLGKNARIRVEQDFTAERMVELTLASYQRALAE